MFLKLVLSISGVFATFSTIGQQCIEDTQYFDLSSFSCQTCSSTLETNQEDGMIPDLRRTEFQDSPTSCTCGPGTIKVASSNAETCFSKAPQACSMYQCETCASGTGPSQDQSRCISCGSLGLNSTSKDCLCGKNSKLIEGETEKTCEACPENAYSLPGAYECTVCSDEKMKYIEGQGCVCESGYENAGLHTMGSVRCVQVKQINAIDTKFPSSGATKAMFADFDDGTAPITVDSALYSHYFIQVATQCYFYTSESHARACRALANLCILQHYNVDAVVCALFRDIQTRGRTSISHNIAGWAMTLPLLEYSERSQVVLNKVDISMLMTHTNDEDELDRKTIDFKLAVFSMNGTFLGMEDLDKQFMYCGTSNHAAGGPSYNSQWLKFGHGYSETYRCDLETLLESDTLFYELYLIDQSPGTNGTLYPVPVRVLNYRGKSGTLLNRNSAQADKDDDKLTHGFFFFDTVSGRDSAQAIPQVIRYASTISLQLRTQDVSSDRIYPPVLTIEYTDVVTPRSVPLYFKAEYTSNTSGFWSTAIGLFLTTCALCCFIVVLRYFNWQRRNTRGGNDPLIGFTFVIEFIAMSASMFSFLTFWLLFLLSQYYFIAFKLQKTVSTLLPEDIESFTTANEYYTFKVVLVLCFWLQLLSVMKKIYDQTNVDVFFMDWEKSRAKLVDSDSVQSIDAPVSVWRTILVANEWNELQTVRQTNIEFTLFALVFLLIGCKFEYLATPQPTASDLSSGPLNPYLRFANTSAWWLILSLVQFIWKWAIYERFFSEPKTQEFMDLCTMAKVSCLILDEKYHGFYLHCRSPYPFADGSMVEIADQLKQEEAGLMSGRGLQGGPPDLQTFEIFITCSWRKNYDKIYATLLSKHNTKSVLETGRLGKLHGSKKSKAPPSKLVKASRKLNLFLKDFVENHQEDYRWKIQEEQGILSQWLQIPPEMGSKRVSIFLPDHKFLFSKVLLLGIEMDLMIFNILTLSVFDLWLDNTSIAILLTYAVEQLMLSIRNHWGNQNVAEKTLVDDRFLI